MSYGDEVRCAGSLFHRLAADTSEVEGWHYQLVGVK